MTGTSPSGTTSVNRSSANAENPSSFTRPSDLGRDAAQELGSVTSASLARTMMLRRFSAWPSASRPMGNAQRLSHTAPAVR